MKLRLMNQDGRGEIGFVDVPDDFTFPETVDVNYPNIQLIWGRYRLWSRNLATYRWFENVSPPPKERRL